MGKPPIVEKSRLKPEELPENRLGGKFYQKISGL
jgi:hypothetical protein